MKFYRNLVRFCFKRASPLKTIWVKFTGFFVLLLFIFAFIQEKQEKEAMIELALGSRNVDDLVLPDNDTLILSPEKQEVKNPFIVIVVTSLPRNFQRRNIIRQTWARKGAENGVSVVFFVGKPESQEVMESLSIEANHLDDLVVDDFSESYYALSIKTLRVFKYFKFHYPKAKFLVKTDDDVFVNVPNLVRYCYTINKQLEQRLDEREKNQTQTTTLSYFLGGVIHDNRGPHTWNAFSKWYAPAEVWHAVYEKVFHLLNGNSGESVLENESELGKSNNARFINENQYPPYAEGNFYILSDSTVSDILRVSRHVPLYHLEDIYVTGVLATWVLNIAKEDTPFISSASNFFPRLSYVWYKIFVPSKEIIAFHCDNYVELISLIYQESFV